MALMLPFMAHAEVTAQDISSNFNDLPETTRIALAAQIAKAKEDLSPTAVAAASISPAKVKEWAGVGSVLGKELNSLVTELAMPMGKFLDTGVGQIATVVVLYKIIGQEFARLLFGFLFFVIFLTGWIHFYRKMCIIKSQQKTVVADRKKWHGGPVYETTVEHYGAERVDGTRFLMFIVLVIIVAVSLLVMF